MATKNFGDVNLYELLSIEITAEQSEIRKAYRKKALECHPDKNPDNPKAAELFHELAKALEILTDEAARGAYDKVLKAKKATALRNQQLDSKRQKLKADLEQRERNSTHSSYTVRKSDVEILQEQIERLRREGSKLLEEEQRIMREQLKRTVSDHCRQQPTDASQHRIKIKWKVNKEQKQLNGGYTEEKLLCFLRKYGDIVALVMSKKPGSALVEFTTFDAGEMALSYEKGIVENPLQLEWLLPPKIKKTANNYSPLDFEDLVMRRLRQAEERKRLVEQMLKDDINASKDC